VTPSGSSGDRPSLMRSLGQFVGHVAKGIRTRPGADAPSADAPAAPDGLPTRRHEVDRRVEEEHRDGVILRRTTIEEVEYPDQRPAPPSSDSPDASDSPDTPDTPETPDAPDRRDSPA